MVNVIMEKYTDTQKAEACAMVKQISAGHIVFGYDAPEGAKTYSIGVDEIHAKLGIAISGGDWYAAAYDVIQDRMIEAGNESAYAEAGKDAVYDDDGNLIGGEFYQWAGSATNRVK